MLLNSIYVFLVIHIFAVFDMGSTRRDEGKFTQYYMSQNIVSSVLPLCKRMRKFCVTVLNAKILFYCVGLYCASDRLHFLLNINMKMCIYRLPYSWRARFRDCLICIKVTNFWLCWKFYKPLRIFLNTRFMQTGRTFIELTKDIYGNVQKRNNLGAKYVIIAVVVSSMLLTLHHCH